CRGQVDLTSVAPLPYPGQKQLLSHSISCKFLTLMKSSLKNTMARAIILRSFGPAATVILWALLLLSVVLAAEDPGIYPGKLRIAKAKHLSPEQREEAGRFAASLEARNG